MSKKHDGPADQNVIALLDRIQERVMRAIPNPKSTVVFDGLMEEARAQGLTPLECLDYIEEHRPAPQELVPAKATVPTGTGR